MKINFHWQAYNYFPYEKNIATRELISLTGQIPKSSESGLYIECSKNWEQIAEYTTYYQEVIAENGKKVIPLQTYLEASANGSLNYNLPSFDDKTILNKQNTRYSAHGLHEYKGKFHPQIVRAIGNILNIKQKDYVLDPFCGSGTTLLEAVHNDWNAIGLDINPLAIQIARAKILAIHVPLNDLKDQANNLKHRLQKRIGGMSFENSFNKEEIQSVGGPKWETRIPDFDYLTKWFPISVLVQISAILDEIDQLSSSDIKLIFRIILSDILRQVSLQDPGDLRIRRRKSPANNYAAIPLFLDRITKRIDTISKARQYISNVETHQNVLLKDVRSFFIEKSNNYLFENKFDAAITSPPYVTALPYIDTQRLSLVVLGLISAKEILSTEKKLIGNREINVSERLKIEHSIDTNADNLPNECILFCKKLKDSVDKQKDGFRRQNMPSLVYKYFSDMALMFGQVNKLLKPDAPFALVVGQNKTSLGGIKFIIDTPYLLTKIAEKNGFTIQEVIDLNTYQRFDIHQVNSIKSESLIILRAIDYEN